ncbi:MULTISPECIES: hypothetical protein [Streptomyces]|uniref:hypothetical protein n=1 Tax=Streptomyces TaxID=1883 RepID=UPI00292F232B|nr:hypothetical protein [Streptomyces sp. NEAU-HV9]
MTLHDGGGENGGVRTVDEGVAAALDGGFQPCGLSPVTGTTPIAASPPWPAPIGESGSTPRHPAVAQSLGGDLATHGVRHNLPLSGPMNA